MSPKNSQPLLTLRVKVLNRLVASASASPLVVLLPMVVAQNWMEDFDPRIVTTHVLNGPETFLFGLIAAAGVGICGFALLSLWRWPVRFDCPHCGKSLSTKQPWRCGRCGQENKPSVFWFQTVGSWCGGCFNKPHTMQCPHCLGGIDLVEKPDRRHTAIQIGVEPILPEPAAAPESVGEAEARRQREQEDHEQTLRALEQQTQVIEAQVRRAMAEAKLARYSPKDETEATIGALMKEVQGAFRRSEALLKFRKLKVEEVITSTEHSAEEKEELIEELEDLLQEAKARYL